MPFELAWEPRGVVITYSGMIVAEEVLDCHRRIAADARFDDLRYAIVDTLPVRSISMSDADVEEIDAYLRGPAFTNPNIAVAFVATLPDVLRALTYYDALADHAFQGVVCESLPVARRQLAASSRSFGPRARPLNVPC